MHRDANGKYNQKPNDESEYRGGTEARVCGGCGTPRLGDGVPVAKDRQEETLLGTGRVRYYTEVNSGGGPNQESEEVDN